MRLTFLSILLALLMTSAAGAAMIQGRVVSNDVPVAGIQVYLYGDLDFDDDPLFIAPATDEHGFYQVEVSPGAYALFARDDNRGIFAFCGRNPVKVEQETVWAGLQAVALPTVVVLPYDDEYSAAIQGVVLFDGEPLADAYVSLYLDTVEDLKGQGYRLSLPTGPDGSFFFDGLPESSYYLMARKRMNGNRVGPVLEDDYLGHFPGNPIRAKAGTVTRVTIDTIRKVRSESGSETFAQPAGPVVSGRVVDPLGHPVAGLHVFAYTDRVIGHKRPAALTAQTGADGLFRLNLGQPGIYFIGARQEYGDSPAPGELFGMYEESADHGLEVKSGRSVEDVVITVEPISLD